MQGGLWLFISEKGTFILSLDGSDTANYFLFRKESSQRNSSLGTLLQVVVHQRANRKLPRRYFGRTMGFYF